MNQQRQCGFVGPMKVLKNVKVRTRLSGSPQRLREALEQIAALLRRRQFERLRNIWKNAPKAWRDPGQFGSIAPHLLAILIQARRLRETAFKDPRQTEIG